MSAISVLYSGNTKKPSWTKFEEDEMSLSEANYIVPLFWFAMFGKVDFKLYYDQDGESLFPWKNFVPYLSATKDQCLKNFHKNSKFLSSFAKSSEEYLTTWQAFIQESSGDFISVDVTELYFMEPEIKPNIKKVISGFRKPTSDTVASIVDICGAQYDQEKGGLLPDGNNEIHYHLLGLNPNGDKSWHKMAPNS